MRFLSQILVSNLLLFLMSSVFADEYRIEAEQSYIHVITSRQGALKRLAHRHVVELGPLEGKVSYEANGNSTAELQLTPEAFFVDRPQTTALYPEIWDKPVNESAASGTKKNMTGEKLLHVTQFPVINVAITLEPGSPTTFITEVTIKGQSYTLNLPGTLTEADNTITATAEFPLTHEQLGLKPFKAGAGLIAVGDEMLFRVKIIASKTSKE